MKINPSAGQKNQDLIESFSGIRGIYGQGITKELAYNYALAYCRLLKDKISSLVVGGDSRSSTLILKKSIIKAFKDWGVEKIIDVGVLPVQVCQYASLKFKAQGGVYISASHNEPEYNGWKFLKEDGALLYPKQAERLIKKAHKIYLFKQKRKKSRTKVINHVRNRISNVVNKNKEVVDKYIGFVLKKIGKKGVAKIKKSKFKILVDPNGGSGIIILEKLFKKIGVQAKIINNRLGQFFRLIEPNIESLTYLNTKVDNGKFEFACGFDCDADRIEFVIPSNSKFAKEMGQIVSGQYVLALACDAYLEDTKNQIVVTNDCTSYLVRDIIKKYGAKIKEVEVGEMNVVEEMEKQKSIIGGEGSCGGVIIPPIKCRDGIMTTCLILKMISQRGRSLIDILEDYPKYYSDRTIVSCSPFEGVKIKNKLEKYYKSKGYEIKKTGGVTGGLKTLIDKNSYLWFRQSKTEPGIFRIITDGNDYKKVKKILKEGVKSFNKFKK